MKKGLAFTALLCAFGIGLAACTPAKADPTYVVTIANKDALTPDWEQDKEDTRTAIITIKGENNDEVVDAYNAIDAGDLVVTSSNTSVVTISGYGVINLVGAGESTVTATYKNKFSDSVKIKVLQERAIRPAFTLDVNKTYKLGLVPSDGKTQYATGAMSGYYLQTGNFEKAADAKVEIDPDATGDFKYVIKLITYKTDGTKDKELTLGSCFNENDKGKHYNIGFEGNKVDNKYTLVKALFKFDAEKYAFTTMVAVSDTEKVECMMGTSGAYKTLQYGPLSENKIAYPAHMYEEGDPIHPETVKIDLEAGETEITLRPGFSRKLSYTCTPDFVTDSGKWDVLEGKENLEITDAGVISAIGAAGTTATVQIKVHKKTATVNVKIQGEPIQYGTLEQPLTIAEAKAQLDELGDNFITTELMYVRGVVGLVEKWDEANANRNVWLRAEEDGKVNDKAFELYRCKDSKDLLPGQTVTGVGYGEKYVGSSATYEFTVARGENPTVKNVVVPDLTGISVADITVGTNAEAVVEVVAEPEGAVLPSVSLAWKDAEQDVAEIVAGELKVKGLKEGEATLVVTAGTFEKEAKVTVTNEPSNTKKDTLVVKEFENAPSSYTTDGTEYKSVGGTSSVEYYATGINANGNVRGNKTAQGGNFNLRNATGYTGYYIYKLIITTKGTGTMDPATDNRSVLILGTSAFAKITDATVPAGTQVKAQETAAGTTLTFKNLDQTFTFFQLYSLKTGGTCEDATIEVIWAPIQQA